MFVLGTAGVLAGCSSQEDRPPSLRPVEPDASTPGAADRDGDGLCDSTERELGTDLDDPDSDGDGVPDFDELIYGLEPGDSSYPTRDQVGYISAVRGATLDFPIRLTVEAEGSDLTGYFEPLSSPYVDGSSARDFFISAAAVEAQPLDAVRAVDAESQRFVQLVGSARLESVVRFETNLSADSIGCARVYPFRYSFKDDTGDRVAGQLYLLILAADPGAEDLASDFCGPASCT